MMMRLWVLALAAAAFMAAPAQASDEADPTARDEAVDDTPFPRFGLGVRAGGILLAPGFLMLGPALGLDGRVRLHEWIAVEPHVDLVAPMFFIIGLVGAQAGLPLILLPPEQPGLGGARVHFGAGPVVSAAIPVGHVESPLPLLTFVGAEAVLGVGWPVTESLELRLQGRAFMLSTMPKVILFPGATATAGVLWTF